MNIFLGSHPLEFSLDLGKKVMSLSAGDQVAFIGLNFSVWPNSCVLYSQIIKNIYENLIKETSACFAFLTQRESRDRRIYKEYTKYRFYATNISRENCYKTETKVTNMIKQWHTQFISLKTFFFWNIMFVLLWFCSITYTGGKPQRNIAVASFIENYPTIL